MGNHPSRFDPAKNYTQVLFTNEARHAHTHDLNDAQAIIGHRVKGVGDALMSDGNVIRGGIVSVEAKNGATIVEAGDVYIDGAVHSVGRAEFTIPVDRLVAIGLCVTKSVITHEMDTDLKGKIPGTRAFGEPGADRQKVDARWIHDGQSCENGDFFVVYQVINGVVVDNSPPPQFDPVNTALARFDREANGHYIVEGWKVLAIGHIEGSQHFSIGEGTINVWGSKISRASALRWVEVEDPDLHDVNSEPHVLGADIGNTVVLPMNHTPLAGVDSVTIQRRRTATITHGAWSGVSDALPDLQIVRIEGITQGDTTYTLDADFVLDNDKVNWAPAGQEPAPGSTYSVTYHYLDNCDPDTWDDASVTISGAVPGSTVIVDYRWALPRIDALAVDRVGQIHYIKGQAAINDPWPPRVPNDLLKIADIINKWGRTAEVRNVGTHSVHYNKLEALGDQVDDLFDLLAQERLKRDMDASQPTAKRGVFVDPFNDDDMRDQGLTQTAAIFNNTLNLPIETTVTTGTMNFEGSGGKNQVLALPYTQEVVVEQAQATTKMKINPYQAFEPLPARVHLDPAVDMWTETKIKWTHSRVYRWWWGWHGWWYGYGYGWYGYHHYGPWWHGGSSTTKVSEVTEDAEFLRQREVKFEIEGFGGGEILDRVTFDGIEITPWRVGGSKSALTTLVADDNGELEGMFEVPANIPAGTKDVVFEGRGATRGQAAYIGSGKITTTTMRRVTYAYWPYYWWWGYCWVDPLAQTFRLTESRHLTSADIKFTTVGDTSKPVIVQIRETENGIPSSEVMAATIVNMAQVQTDVWTNVAFEAPVFLDGDNEYCLVLLTDDANHEVAISGLGEYDREKQQYITQQPYQVGVLLSSSNASTWTPHQNLDLTFRLNAAKFTVTEREIELSDTITLTDCTDLIIRANSDEPDASTGVTLKLTRANGEEISFTLGQPLRFDEPLNETIAITVLLKGGEKHSPLVYPWLQIVQGTVGDEGVYISRAMPSGTDSMNAVVTFDALFPSASGAKIEVGRDGAWQEASLVGATPLGDGWQERNYVLPDYVGTDARIKIILRGSNTNRPQIKNLRCNVTADPVNIITG